MSYLSERAAKVVRNGNPTNTAWLRGWDAGITGQTGYANPYSRRPQKEAWDRGRASGLRSSAVDVLAMKNRTKAAAYRAAVS